MPTNRLVALTGALTAIGAFLTALLDAFESEAAKAAVAGTALLVFGAISVVFLLGWQKHEEREYFADMHDAELAEPPR